MYKQRLSYGAKTVSMCTNRCLPYRSWHFIRHSDVYSPAMDQTNGTSAHHNNGTSRYRKNDIFSIHLENVSAWKCFGFIHNLIVDIFLETSFIERFIRITSLPDKKSVLWNFHPILTNKTTPRAKPIQMVKFLDATSIDKSSTIDNAKFYPDRVARHTLLQLHGKNHLLATTKPLILWQSSMESLKHSP